MYLLLIQRVHHFLEFNSLINIELGNGLNGSYKSTELQQQMLEMRDDPAMSYHTSQQNSSTPDDKELNRIDCSSLSSEIFLATRLLHDETLDSTTLTMDEPEVSYNNQKNYLNCYESPIQNDSSHQNTTDSVGGLNQQETLDRDLLYNSFLQLNSNRAEVNCDEYSNKSWTETMTFSEIMPSSVSNISKNNYSGRKYKGERKQKSKIIKKDTINVTKINFVKEMIQTQVSIEKVPELRSPISGKSRNNENEIKEEEINIKEISPSTSNKEPTAEPDFQRTNFRMNYIKELPSKSSIKIQYIDGRKVPSYLRMFKMKDERYTEVFACKYCYGIFTTLDSAIFHPCIKKRRGRKPKILEDCLVPL